MSRAFTTIWATAAASRCLTALRTNSLALTLSGGEKVEAVAISFGDLKIDERAAGHVSLQCILSAYRESWEEGKNFPEPPGFGSTQVIRIKYPRHCDLFALHIHEGDAFGGAVLRAVTFTFDTKALMRLPALVIACKCGSKKRFCDLLGLLLGTSSSTKTG